MNKKLLPLYLLITIISLQSPLVFSQLFESKTTLHSSDSYNDYYTESIYSGIDSYNGAIYFVKIDQNRKPMVGKIENGNTTLEFLAKDLPGYQARASDGHHEFSIGIDKDGYIHVTGDMHNQPQASNGHLPAEIEKAEILYWKSDAPGDISNFSFMGFNNAEKIPGKAWSYGLFERDRNGVLYYSSRTLARTNYYQKWDEDGGVGRGLGLYVYNTATKSWTARGELAPGMSDASYKVIVYDPSGHAPNQSSYQQYKAGIFFDKTNRMHLALGMNINEQTKLNCIIYAYSDDGGITFHKANGDNIQLPMTGDDGPRQADVLVNNTDNSTDMDQAVVCAAWDNYPVVHYLRGSGKHQYWDGTSWIEQNSPTGKRDIITFNEHTNQLYFIDIHGGTIHAKSSITGSTTTYNSSSKFQHYDINTFRSQNIMNVLSWQSSKGSGDFEIIQLVGANVGPPLDCNDEPGGTAAIDDCGTCSGGSTGITPNSTCKQDCNGTWGGTAVIDDCENCVGGTTGEISCNRTPFNGTPISIPGIIEAEEYDIGENGGTYNDLTPDNTGQEFRSDDVDIEIAASTPGNYNVGWVEANEWLEYSIDVQATNNYTFDFQVATLTGSDGFHLSIDGTEIIPSTSIDPTGGWQEYATVSVDNIPLNGGEHLLRLTFDGSALNFDKVNVTPSVVLASNSGSTQKKELKIFPNPISNEALHVRLPMGELGKWEIIDAQSNVVKTGFTDNQEFLINLSNNQSGLYLLRFTGKHANYNTRLILTD